MGLFDSLKQMFTGGGARYYHDRLGLAADEDFKVIITGTLWQEPTKADNAEAVALGIVGLFTGHTVEQTGVHATFGITTNNRLVVGMIGGKDSDPLAFEPSTGCSIVDTGQQSKDTVMGPTGRHEPGKMLAVKQQDSEVFQLIVPASKAGEFIGWQ